MNDRGWIKLHRELLNKTIWINSTPEQKTILITFLLMANHEPKQWEWQGKKYIVQSGEFITSLNEIVKRCGKGVTTQNVRTAIARFEKLKFLTNKSTKQNRLIKIENWGLYQGDENSPNKATNNHLTNASQTTNKRLTTNKNYKNDKNDKNIYNISSDEEIFVNPKIKKAEKEKSVPKDFIEKVIKRFNQIDGVQQVSKFDDKRYKSFMAIYKKYGEDDILKALKNIENSDFLQGKIVSNNRTPFKLSFNWFLNSTHFLDILEGKYNNRGVFKTPEKEIKSYGELI